MSTELDRAIRAVRTRTGRLEITPTVLADRSNLVLALDEQLVARVAMATSSSRVGTAWLRREVEISRFLGSALSTQPSTLLDAGPHEIDGLVVSFWQRETLVGPLDPRDAGSTLAACHRALERYPKEALQFMGAWAEARAVLPRARVSEHVDASELRALEHAFERAERIVEGAAERSASMQAVHGDAHLGNALPTRLGTRWTDWEDACIGPVELDLASLRSKAELFGEDVDAIEAACGAYGGPFDPELVRDLGLVRNVQVIVWLAVFAERQPELAPRLKARIARLR